VTAGPGCAASIAAAYSSSSAARWSVNVPTGIQREAGA
jgi:hypothetical protein